MKTITINVPDDFKIPEGYEVKIIKIESKFKKGDIITSMNGLIAVFEKLDVCPKTGNVVVYFSTLYSPSLGLKHINNIGFGIGKEKDCKFATTEEVNALINALRNKACCGNEDAKKVLKEVFNIEYHPIIRTYQDLIDNRLKLNGYFINGKCKLASYNIIAQKDFSEDVAASEKVAKSMLAMAQISQLMPYYGGEITDDEWISGSLKFGIIASKDANNNLTIIRKSIFTMKSFLTFHTQEQRDNFIKYNEQLVKDYLMID